MDIISGLAAIKQTLDITKDLRNIDARISDAEYKLRLADLVELLLEAREALQDAKERERLLNEEVAKLKGKLDRKPLLRDRDGLLFEINESGAQVGDPFCNQCFVKEDKLYRLQYGPHNFGSHKCSNCKEIYGKRGNNFSSELTTDYDPLDPSSY